MKITTRFHLNTAFSIGMVLVIGLMLAIISLQVRETLQKEDAIHQIIKGIFELNLVTSDYLVSHREQAREQWQLRYDSLTQLIQSAKFQTPEEQVLFEEMRQNYENLGIIFSRLITHYESRKVSGERTSEAAELEKRLIGDLLMKSQIMASNTEQLAGMNHREIMLTQQKADFIVMLLVIVIAGLIVVNSLLIGRSVVKPIAKLHKGSKIIGAGNLDYKVGTSTKDEIGQLSRAFDQMIERLQAITVSRDELAREITERKRAEEALRESHELLEGIMENSPSYIFGKDAQGRYVFINSPLARFLGTTRDDVVGKRDHDYFPREMADQFQREDAEILKTGTPLTAYREMVVDDKLRFSVTKKFPLRDAVGKPSGIAGFVTDITERKRAEEALKESEEKFRILFEQAADPIVLVDAETQTLVDFNNLAPQNLGFTREEFRALTIQDLEVVESPEDIKEHAKKLRREGEDTFETQLRAKTGEIRDFLIKIKAVSFGGKDYFLSILHDITERKRAEEQLKKSLREKEVLLQELYHRTKNNMTVIGAMLSMQAESLDDQRLTWILEEIKQRIISMAIVHEQLYESQDLSHVNLREYTRQLANSLLANYHIGPGKIALKVDVEPIVVLIETAIPYGLIINELMTNALKYAFPDDRDGEIRITLHRLPEEQELELRFHDNGIGMPKDLDIRKTKSFGMKLITLLIDLQFKGTVDVQVNTGTEFRIRFRELNYKARV